MAFRERFVEKRIAITQVPKGFKGKKAWADIRRFYHADCLLGVIFEGNVGLCRILRQLLDNSSTYR